LLLGLALTYICAMLKDIKLENNANVGVAIVKELNDDLEVVWNVFVVNLGDEKVVNIFTTCKGYGTINGEQKETSVMRYFLDDIDPQTAIKVEPINPDLFQLNNEYFVVFYQDGNMVDKKLTFAANTINDDNLVQVPVLDCLGILLT
jgi:hypothetical protein